MVSSVGNCSSGAVDAGRLRGTGVKDSRVADAAKTEEKPGFGGVGARLAREGAPIDGARIEALRQRVAAGDYRVDADAIAAHMLAADLSR